MLGAILLIIYHNYASEGMKKIYVPTQLSDTSAYLIQFKNDY
jgi:hypothetical protein